tara:strand:+ start:915 stop:1220 length:306 start_codon:yes stop_codon:yes gene_type:complete
MKKTIKFLTIIFTLLALVSCETVSKKIDDKTTQEEKELTKWLNQPESELKIVFGQPDRVDFLESKNRYYVYISQKLKIKCERKFEINPNNMIVGFTSKNCF